MSDHDEPMSKRDHSKKEGGGKPCFSDAELAGRLALQGRKQLFLGANAAVTRCLRRVFLRSSSIKLGFSDVSDSISLSQAVLYSKKISSANNFVKSDRQAVRQEFIFVKRIARFVFGRSVHLLIGYLHIHDCF